MNIIQLIGQVASAVVGLALGLLAVGLAGLILWAMLVGAVITLG